MDKRNRWSRLLAFMLTIVMVLSNQAVITYAETVGVKTAPSEKEESQNADPTLFTSGGGESGGTQMSRDAVVSALGLAQNFAVFAINFNNNNHMEGSIAVKNLNGASSNIGNTDQVYNYTTNFKVTITKNAAGESGQNNKFKFGFYKKSGENYELVTDVGDAGYVSVTTDGNGNGSTVVTSDKFSPKTIYYVFEVDDNNNPVVNGNGTIGGVDYQVTYSTNGIQGDNTVSSVGNASYIEYFKQPGCGVELFQSNGVVRPSVVIGETNTVSFQNANQGTITGTDGSTYNITDQVEITKVNGTFPINFENELTRLQSVASTLAGLKDSDTVKVVYVPMTSNGEINLAGIYVNGEYPFKNDGNAWNNNGINTDGKLLVINVDCTNAGNNISIKGCKIDGQNPMNWNSVANRVVWNFYTAGNETYSPYTGTISYNGGLGTILAPGATVSCKASTNGSVIARTVDHPSCEIHHIKLTESSTTVERKVSCGNKPREVQTASLKLIKSDTDNSTRLADAEFDLYNAKGTKINSEPLVTNANGEITVNNLDAGSYYFIETKAPEGYILPAAEEERKTETVTIAAGTTETVTVTKGNTSIKSTQLSIEGKKTLTGRELETNEFTFQLTEVQDESGKTVLENGTVLTTANGADGNPGKFRFAPIIYTKTGSHYYKITEESGDLEGITYDSRQFIVKVTVSADSNGQLTANAEYPDGGIAFSNEYEIELDVNVPAIKTVNGEKPGYDEDGNIIFFEFIWADITGYHDLNGYTAQDLYEKIEGKFHKTQLQNYVNSLKEPYVRRVSNSADGKINIGQKFDRTGTYYFTLYEAPLEGTLYDHKDIFYIYKIVITDLKQPVSTNPGAANTLGIVAAVPMPSQGNSEETYHGEDYTNQTVTFENIVKKASVKLVKSDEITGKKLSGAKFDFYMNGEKIREGLQTDENGELVIGNLDAGSYYFVETEAPVGYVIPTGDAAKTETVVITSKEISGKDPVAKVVGMTNKAAQISLSLKGAKITNNISGTQTFTFSIIGGEATTVSVGTYSNGTITFAPITYNMKDWGTETEKTYTYTIQEDIPDEAVKDSNGNYVFNNIYYDAAEIPLSVTVKYENGNLRVSEVKVNNQIVDVSEDGCYNFADAYTFENYTPSETSIAIPVAKEIDGWISGTNSKKEFTFTLVPTSASPVSCYKENGNSVAFTTEKPLQENITGKGTGKFDTLYFKEAGIYTYILSEAELNKDDGLKGYSKDRSKYLITVAVGDHNSELQIDSVTYTKIEDENGQAIAEENLKNASGDGKEIPDTGIVFTNKYTTKGTEYQLPVTKVITGLPQGDSILNRTFFFTLAVKDGENGGYTAYDTDSKKYSNPFSAETITIIGSDTEQFRKIYFDKAGTYVYTLKEQNVTAANQPGYTKDPKEYTVTVTVEDINSQLTVTNISYEQSNITGDTKEEGSFEKENATGVTFTNSYKAADTELTVSVNKLVTGISNHLAAGKTFGFDLYEADENYDIAEGTSPLRKTTVTIGTDGTGSSSFAPLTYSTDKNADGPGTYYYVVREQAAGNGFANNTAVYKVKVVITDDGSGTLKKAVTVNGTAASAADNTVSTSFVNNYTAEGNDSISGIKEVKNGNLKSFNFGIFTDQECTEAASANNVNQTASSSADDGSFQFDFHYTMDDLKNHDGTYKDSDTFYYYIRETGTAPGYTMSSAIYKIEVTLSNAASNGTLAVQASVVKKITTTEEDASEMVFTNTYNGKGNINLNGTKTVEGANQKDGFTFRLYEGSSMDTAEPASGENGRVAKNSVTSTDGSFVFNIRFTMKDLAVYGDADHPDQITGYDTARDFTFFVKEEDVPAGYVNRNNTYYKVTYHVTDNGDGTLSIACLSMTKHYTENGEEKTEDVTDSASADFVNDYAAKGETTLSVKKVLTGTVMTEGQFKFILTAADAPAYDEKVSNGAVTKISDNGPKYEASAAFPKLSYTMEALKAADDQGNISYESEKIFTYLLTEEIPDPKVNHYTYDENQYEVQVTVKDEGNGELNVTKAVYRRVADESQENGYRLEAIIGDTPVFHNFYTIEGELKFAVNKILNGQSLKAGQFKFALSSENDKQANAAQTVPITAEGSVEFAPLRYDQSDVGKTYYYTIKETRDENDKHHIYDEKEYTFEVTVTDVNGTAKADVTDTTAYTDNEEQAAVNADSTLVSVTFKNYYLAKGDLTLTGTKKLTGKRSSDIGEGEFTFVVKEDGETVTAGRTEAGKTENGISEAQIVFEPISYEITQKTTPEEAAKILGEHTYTVEEVKDETASASITYSKELYTVTVEVYDKEDGTLGTRNLKIKGQGKVPVFTNQYQAEGTGEVSGTKTLTGNRAKAMEAGEFEFAVVNTATNATVGTAVNAADGSFTITFGKDLKDGKVVPFTQEDIGATYVFRITEVEGNDATIDYSDAEFYAAVTVTDSGKKSKNGKGLLNTEVKYYEDAECLNEVKEAAYTNHYKATGKAVLETTKTLTGRDLSAGEFYFNVYEVLEDGSKVLVRDAENNALTASNTAEGKVVFGEILYTQDDLGTHHYEITEVQGSDTAITYDSEPVRVSVTVEDKDSNGTLAVTVAYEEEGHTGFTNEYQADGSVTFTGMKEILGRRGQDVKDGEFTFTVTDNETETTAATGKTRAGGVIEFTTIQYTEADKGTHTYTITEDTGEDATIEYSKESFEVTVEVKDKGDGTLEAIPAYPEGGVVFRNQYRAEGELVIDNITKVLEGSTLAEGQFTFELKDAEGSILQTAANGADGKAAFEALKYTEEDINREYIYTVSEAKKDVTGVTFDETVYTIHVKVEDSEESDGTLKITAAARKGEDTVETMTFTNQFAGSVTLTKKGEDGRLLADAKFQLFVNTAEGEAEESWAPYTGDTEDGIYTTDASGVIAVENLPANDYYFVETEAPKGYVIETAEDGRSKEYHFTIGVIDGDAGIAENAEVNAELSAFNAVEETGSIQVTKRVTALDGDEMIELIMSDDTFYVNLFTDPEGTIPYREDAPKALHLENASTATVTFDNLAAGTYYVFETDADGKVIPIGELTDYADGMSQYACLVEGETNEVQLDMEAEEKEGYVNLNNCFCDLPDGASIEACLGIGKTSTSPKTGDDTPIGMYLLLLVAAIGLAVGSIYKKKK